MAEYIELVRRYLRGDPEGYDGEFFSPSRTAFWEAFAPERASIPIYNGALGPGNVRLTGQFADGWVPNLYPDSQFKEAKGWLADGAARGDRDPASIDVAMYVLTAVDEDPERARRAAAEHIAYYLRDIPGYYDRAAVEAGFEDVVDAVRDAPSTDAGAERVETGLLDHLAVVGTPEEARAQLDHLREIGVDLPIVRAPPDRQGVGGAHAGSVRAVAMSRRVVAVSRLLCAVAMRRSPRVGTLRVPEPSPSPTELCDSSSYWHSLT